MCSYICTKYPPVATYLCVYNYVHGHTASYNIYCIIQLYTQLFINTIDQVLIYNGQLDVIVGGPLTERFLLVLDWDRAAAYGQADRHVWKIKSTDTEVAGFVRQVNNFTQVLTIRTLVSYLYCTLNV